MNFAINVEVNTENVNVFKAIFFFIIIVRNERTNGETKAKYVSQEKEKKVKKQLQGIQISLYCIECIKFSVLKLIKKFGSEIDNNIRNNKFTV